MKKKFLALGLVFTMAITSLVGCGKADKASDEKTVTEDSNVNAAENVSEDTTDSSEVAASEESTGRPYGYNNPLRVPACEEIMNAELTDCKFQVDDCVVTLKLGMRFEDFYNQFSDNFELDRENSDEEILSYLVPAGEKSGAQIYSKLVDGNNQPMFLNVGNPTDQTCELRDCYIIYVEFDERYNGSVYLAKGIPVTDLDALANDVRFNYGNIANTLKEFGIEQSEFGGMSEEYLDYAVPNTAILEKGNDDLGYSATVVGDASDVAWMKSPTRYCFSITIDPGTRKPNFFNIYWPMPY